MVDDINDKPVDKKETDDKPGWKKALWFVGLWLGGVVAISFIGLIIKSVLS